jgi:hypothetical protein
MDAALTCTANTYKLALATGTGAVTGAFLGHADSQIAAVQRMIHWPVAMALAAAQPIASVVGRCNIVHVLYNIQMTVNYLLVANIVTSAIGMCCRGTRNGSAIWGAI